LGEPLCLKHGVQKLGIDDGEKQNVAVSSVKMCYIRLLQVVKLTNRSKLRFCGLSWSERIFCNKATALKWSVYNRDHYN